MLCIHVVVVTVRPHLEFLAPGSAGGAFLISSLCLCSACDAAISPLLCFYVGLHTTAIREAVIECWVRVALQGSALWVQRESQCLGRCAAAVDCNGPLYSTVVSLVPVLISCASYASPAFPPYAAPPATAPHVSLRVLTWCVPLCVQASG